MNIKAKSWQKNNYNKKLFSFIYSLVLVSLASCGGSNQDGTIFQIKFKNISATPTFTAENRTPVTAAFSSIIGIMGSSTGNLYTLNRTASVGLENLSENGNPERLLSDLRTTDGIEAIGIANEPSNGQVGLLVPGQEFTLIMSSADSSAKLNLATSFLQGNDIIIATPENGIPLFDVNGIGITGDITSNFAYYDTGTEVNQAPGIGSNQVLRQSPVTNVDVVSQGTQEQGVVSKLNDGFSYPAVNSVIKVTISVLEQSSIVAPSATPVVSPVVTSPTPTPEVSPTETATTSLATSPTSTITTSPVVTTSPV